MRYIMQVFYSVIQLTFLHKLGIFTPLACCWTWEGSQSATPVVVVVVGVVVTVFRKMLKAFLLRNGL